jgi:hypothetical protein
MTHDPSASGRPSPEEDEIVLDESPGLALSPRSDDDGDLVIDDGTVPVSDSADVDTIFGDDEEIVLEDDDSDSVEVVVKIQPDAKPKTERPKPVMRPRPEPEKKPVEVRVAAPVEPPKNRIPRWWIAAAAGLLLLLGAGIFAFFFATDEPRPVMVAFRPPQMEPVPEPSESTDATEEPAPEPVAEAPKPLEQSLPPAPAPAEAPAPVAVETQKPVEPVAKVETTKATPPPSDEDKNIETSSIAADETIVELKNGNTFAGRLRRFDAKGVSLEIWNGIISLSSEQLRGFLGSDSPEYQPIGSMPMGYVELPNRNRIYGRIFKVTDSRIILAVSGARFGFSPEQVKVGYLKPGEEPPAEPGFQPAPDSSRSEPPRPAATPGPDGPRIDPAPSTETDGEEDGGPGLEKEPTRP